MGITQKLQNTNEVSYASPMSVKDLKKRIEGLFNQNALRLSGRLGDKNVFTIYDKTVVIGWNMPNLKRRAAYLKGEITQQENGAQIKLSVQPNAILPIFAVAAVLIGIVMAVLATPKNNNNFLFLAAGFVALGMVYYPVSTFLRNRLQNKVVKQLELTKV